MGLATKEPRRNQNYGPRELSLIRLLQVLVAIPVQCPPLEQGWLTGPQKPVYGLRREPVRQLTSTSELAEDVRHMWEELAGAKKFISHEDAGTQASFLMK